MVASPLDCCDNVTHWGLATCGNHLQLTFLYSNESPAIIKPKPNATHPIRELRRWVQLRNFRRSFQALPDVPLQVENSFVLNSSPEHPIEILCKLGIQLKWRLGSSRRYSDNVSIFYAGGKPHARPPHNTLWIT